MNAQQNSSNSALWREIDQVDVTLKNFHVSEQNSLCISFTHIEIANIFNYLIINFFYKILFRKCLVPCSSYSTAQL